MNTYDVTLENPFTGEVVTYRVEESDQRDAILAAECKCTRDHDWDSDFQFKSIRIVEAVG